jgi:polyol transport system permease protein
MTSITDTAPVPASRTTEGAARRTRPPQREMILGMVAWLIGILFVLPGLWMLLTSVHWADAATTRPSIAAPR